MSLLQQTAPHVKKSIFLIRLLLAVTLFFFAFFFTQSHPDQKNISLAYALLLIASFLPFYFTGEEKFEKVRFQYLVFSMDFVFLLGGVYLFDHFDKNLLILIFLTFFISALSQSVGRSIFVSIAVISLYVYLIYYKSDHFNYYDPFLFLSCALLLVVAIHSGYMAYRTVQEEKELLELARKANLLSERVKEGNQAALEYAATLKNVLDTLPIGAIAVSTEGYIIFVNARAGKVLDLHPKVLLNVDLFSKGTLLGDIGELMAKSIKNRVELKREYLDTLWNNKAKRFRLDSSTGANLTGKIWGTLFLIQETQKPLEPKSDQT